MKESELRLLTGVFRQDEWTELVSRFRNLSLMQTWEYADAKARTGPWKIERAVFMREQCIIGAVQALVRAVPWVKRGFVWINRGPLLDIAEGKDDLLLIAMLERLRRYWVEQRHMYLRIAPPIYEDEVDDKALEAAGFHLADGPAGWASALIDLSKSEEQLRRELSGNWRKQLGRAERLGVGCMASRSSNLFEDCVSHYKDFLLGRKLSSSVTPQLLEQLQRLLPDERKMWVFEGRLAEERLGSLLVACYGDTCMYLALALNERGRAVHGGYVMHWQAIVTMKRQGFRWFDVGGLDRQRTPSGIFQFKAGLGGKPYRLMGEIEAHDGRWLSQVVRLGVCRVRQFVQG